MKISKFSIFVDGYPSVYESLAFNTRTHALVKISSDFKALLERLEESDYADLLPYEDKLLHLYKIGIVVRDEADDIDRFERFIDRRKYGVDTRDFVVTLLTTYSCNFACTYCFEETTRGSGQKMSKETADAVMVWTKKRVKRYQVKQCTINYYGGEPLLNQPIMEYVSSHMQEWCRSQGVRFKVNIQTNGALFTPEFIDKHKKWGLETARISLDGTKEVHDRQRPMRGSGGGTFDIIMKNLVPAVDKIQMSIAAGYDGSEPQGILDLLDYLDGIGVLKKLDKFLYSPVHPTLGPKDHPEKLEGMGCMSNYEPDNLLKASAIIKEAMEKKGLVTKSGLSTSMCPLTRESGSPTVDTNGLIFKCNSMLGHPDLAVGNVMEDEYNAKQQEFMSMEAFRQCDDSCPYKPLCNTGCRLFGFFKHGDFAAKSCSREYMDKFVPNAIKKEYELRMAAKQPSPQPA